MRHGYLTVLRLLSVAVIFSSALACNSKGESYIGRWECASGGGTFFEIKANKGALLITDESGKTYPGSIDDMETLVVSGVPMMGSLPLPIDSNSGELICSACDCNRYARVDSRQSNGDQSPVRDQDAQKKTVSDIRNVGTAMFSWLTDQVGASAAGQAQTGLGDVVELSQYPLISHERLQKILVPQYLQEIPVTDGWGHPYEFYLNDKDVTKRHVMSIRSAGRDGRFSTAFYEVSSFFPTDFDEDIVWSDGFFVRWPQKQ